MDEKRKLGEVFAKVSTRMGKGEEEQPKQAGTTKTANVSGASSFFTRPIEYRPEFASPDRWWVPRDRNVLNGYWRMFYAVDPLAGSVVDMYVEMPLSDYQIVGEGVEGSIKQDIEQMCEDVRLVQLVSTIMREFLVIGEAIPHLFYDGAVGHWTDWSMHKPEAVEVLDTQMLGIEPILILQPPTEEISELRKVVKAALAMDVEVSGVPFLQQLMTKRKVPLEPLNVTFIPRLLHPYDNRGTSLFTRLWRTWMYEDAVSNATLQTAKRHACFVAGTEVLIDAGVKNIEEMKVGDIVVSGQGVHREVEAAWSEKAMETVTISTTGSPDLECTLNHQFKIWRGLGDVVEGIEGVDLHGATGRIKAEDIREGDFLMIPRHCSADEADAIWWLNGLTRQVGEDLDLGEDGKYIDTSLWSFMQKRDFIRGLCESRGREKWKIRSSSLAYQIRHILAQLGVFAEMLVFDDEYLLSFYPGSLLKVIQDQEISRLSDDESVWKDESYIYTRVRALKRTVYTEGIDVYNLTVEGDRSYIANGLQTYNSPVKTVQMGDVNAGFVASTEQEDELLKALAQAEMDPHAWVLVPPTTKFEAWGTTDKLMGLRTEYDIIERLKLLALGTSKDFISGASTFASAQAGLQVFLSRLLSFRNFVEESFVYPKLFGVIVKANNWELPKQADVSHSVRTAKGRNIVKPEIRWAKSLKQRVDRELLDAYRTLVDTFNVKISQRAVCEAAGVKWQDELRKSMEEEIILKSKEEVKDGFKPGDRDRGIDFGMDMGDVGIEEVSPEPMMREPGETPRMHASGLKSDSFLSGVAKMKAVPRKVNVEDLIKSDPFSGKPTKTNSSSRKIDDEEEK